MQKIVGIVFENNARVYYFSANNLDLEKNMSVIVETERGFQLGKVTTDILDIDPAKFGKAIKSVIRIANKQDLDKHLNNLNDAKNALITAKEEVIKLKLPMQISEASYTFDKKQLIFTFVSEKRVDFRELVKVLATKFKTRIELHQIGPRDKAKKIGALGPCGRELCCSKFLNEFDSISINMAKNQNIALNPSKLNGLCGRLKCCLAYEDETYKDCKKCTLKVGTIVKLDEGEGKVISVNPLTKQTRIDIKGVGIIEKVIDTCGSNK